MDNSFERVKTGIYRAFDSHETAALIHVEPLAKLLMDNPDKGIELICSTYNKGLDCAYTNDDGINWRALLKLVQEVRWKQYLGGCIIL